MSRRRLLNFTLYEILWLCVLFMFSVLLMWKTFRLSDGNLLIASKAWSDFAATIPLIRSFSTGSNFPPEYPLYSGLPIKYHFGFYLLVGLLEKVGIPLDIALNGLSTLSFFVLLCSIYLFAKKIFKSSCVGCLSVIFFLFNGSFSFLEFFKNHPLSLNSISEIIKNTAFPSFGPYDGKIVSAFWNLNIFTNQRHLALAYASFLILFFLIDHYSKNPEKLNLKKTLVVGIIVGLFPYIHTAVFGMIGILLITSFLLYPTIRKKIVLIGFTAAALALPQLMYMGRSSVFFDFFTPGYLVSELNFWNSLKYWFLNLGLTSILGFLGFILSDKTQKKILIPFIFLFVIANFFKFSPEIAANHKFFNLFVIGLNMFTAFILVSIWKKSFILKFVTIILIFFLTFSGIIDIFPIFNDHFITLRDSTNNKTATFIKQNTSRDSVFLNAAYLYDSASLAGRKIFLGWPYFSWSAGYDTDSRFKTLSNLLSERDKENLCNSLLKEKIDYVEIQKPSRIESVSVNYEFYEKNMDKIFFDSEEKITIYDVGSTCSNL